ncbi:hypothetical protein HDU87_000965 [Geranomyces variabilis]|uniref:Uncharacterized protein n=1 Tax=Geranomyces variabilis TaxID=109894 RepID=A0AAD5XM26_9FUNG|nr:hypothetical protein HDU87_000965 [Geranomyces variabilis]
MSWSSFPPLTASPSPSCTVKRLFLCRHGQTAANATGVLQGSGIDQSLNDEGVAQAERLRDRLADVPCDLIISSKLKRARETAQFVYQKHSDAPFLEIGELAEISWGEWEGTHHAGLRELWASWEAGDFTAKVPGGESPLEVEKRAVDALYQLMERPESNMIIIVHGRLLRVMMASIFYHSLVRMSEFGHHNTCINVIDVIVDNDHAKLSNPSLADSASSAATAAPRANWAPSGKNAFDDNVSQAPTTLAEAAQATERRKVSGNTGGHLVTAVTHPGHLTFVPVVLDSIDHLSECLP